MFFPAMLIIAQRIISKVLVGCLLFYSLCWGCFFYVNLLCELLIRSDACNQHSQSVKHRIL